MNLKTLEHLRHCQHVLDNFCDILKESISQRPPTQLNTNIFLSVSLLPDVKKTSDFFYRIKKNTTTPQHISYKIWQFVLVFQTYTSKSYYWKFLNKKIEKKITNSSKGKIMNCLFYYTTNFCFICYQNVCDTEPFYYYKLLRN